MKKFYFLLDGDIITDAIEYAVDGYIEVELNKTHLPAGINGGYYRWTGSAYQKDEALYQSQVSEVIKSEIDKYTLELLEAGLL
jgi:hypothetical protein